MQYNVKVRPLGPGVTGAPTPKKVPVAAGAQYMRVTMTLPIHPPSAMPTAFLASKQTVTLSV